jgi:HEAT repeat protein
VRNIAKAKSTRPTPARGIEEQAAALEALRTLPPQEAEPAVRKALQNRNNFLVAKAARLAAELGLKSLVPDLAAAFPRFMPEGGEPAETDPQCWAKNDLAKALAAFEFQEHALFLAGMKHHQYEATWGGETDTAGALRGTCALALVQCREVNSLRLLGWFTELFADPDLTVQVNAARAVEQVGSDAAMLLLKLRAELASGAPELLGACYSGVLHLEGPSAIPWAAKFLAAGDDASAEAAIAIAETRTPEAFELLKSTFTRAGHSINPTRFGDRIFDSDPWFADTLLSAIALTRQDAAVDFLIDLIQSGSRNASAAHEALCRSAPSNATLDRLKQLGRPCPP